MTDQSWIELVLNLFKKKFYAGLNRVLQKGLVFFKITSPFERLHESKFTKEWNRTDTEHILYDSQLIIC